MLKRARFFAHYNDVIMTTVASQITSLTVVYSTVYSDADQRNIKAPRHCPLCGEFTGTGEFPAQRASYAENASIWWRHHDIWACAAGYQFDFVDAHRLRRPLELPLMKQMGNLEESLSHNLIQFIGISMTDQTKGNDTLVIHSLTVYILLIHFVIKHSISGLIYCL